jgi:pimeloyl-ACP methyl ester carboxylesterase
MVLGASEGVALALGTSFRIIVPEVPSPPLSDAAAARWLGGVCEGLGILEVAIVATPALRNAATRFAQDAPDRVKGIIIVDSGTTDAAEFRAAVERIFS